MLRPLLLAPLLLSFAFAVPASAEQFRFDKQENTQTLSLFEGEAPIFSYIYDMIVHENVPQNDHRRVAGCYIHPLYGLNGEILTDNAPADHYHHRGVFWTWPYVSVHHPDGKIDRYDLWTSDTALKQRFVRWLEQTTTETTATFAVENGWFVGHSTTGLPITDNDEKIMKEVVRVVVHRPKTGDGLRTRAIDFYFVWTPIDRPISLGGHAERSYGGLTLRFRPVVEPNRQLAEPSAINVITVPDGVAAEDLSNIRLPWASYTSRFGNDERRSGAAVFVPKTHPDYPPSWLTRHYGPLCIGWPGVEKQTFPPGEDIKLNYRIWIYDAPASVTQIERAYEEY